jgi:hypothetical protein
MAISTLQAIITKIRRLTGSADAFQLTDSQIEDYINSFYNYDFPSKFRSLKLKDTYYFDTIQGIDTYPFNSEQYSTVEMPCFCMNREIKLFTDTQSFYGAFYNWQFQTNFAFADGTVGPYGGLTTGTPILRSVNNDPSNLNYPASRIQNILITANTATGTLNVTDDGNGNLIGDCSAGTVNYFTGTIAGLVFTAAVPAGNPIQIQYNPQQPNIPIGILFYQNQFVLRPVPNQGYTISLTAYRLPTQALEDTPALQGTPELNEWWEVIAFGASKKIYQDRLDLDGVNMMDAFLQEQYSLVETRTYAQLGSQRIGTIFADQLSTYGGSAWGWGAGSGSV